MTADLQGLIERLEKLEEPSREVDALIWCAINAGYMERTGPPNNTTVVWVEDKGWLHPNDPARRVRDRKLLGDIERAPHYTASIDSALTLVPEGFRVAGLWESVYPEQRPWWGAYVNSDDVRSPDYKSLHCFGAKTPALALTIAALRARQADG